MHKEKNEIQNTNQKEGMLDKLLNGEFTDEDVMIHVLQNQKQVNKNVATLQNDVKEIKENTAVNSAISNYLTRKRRGRVIECLGGKDGRAYQHKYSADESNNYKTLSGKAFAEMERDFKDYFKIANYADLPKKKREMAEEYISQWTPSNNTKIEINQVNNQLEILGKE